eukprot:scaffold73701_cov31-Phaeocystis_antarctica.AAC.2
MACVIEREEAAGSPPCSGAGGGALARRALGGGRAAQGGAWRAQARSAAPRPLSEATARLRPPLS